MGRRKRRQRRPESRPNVEYHVEGLLAQIRYTNNRIDIELTGDQTAMTPGGRLELVAWLVDQLAGAPDDWMHWIMSPPGSSPQLPENLLPR